MTPDQIQTVYQIDKISQLIGIDPAWACAVASVESSYGLKQKSPTGARGVFQMTGIAMKDLLQEMEKHDDDLIDICCGILFLRLLLKRHGTIEKATAKFCDPKDRPWYVPKVMEVIEKLKK